MGEGKLVQPSTYNKVFADEVFTDSPPPVGADVRAENMVARQPIEKRGM